MEKPFYKYVDDVLNGRIVVGKYVRLAVERFIRDLDRKEYIFDYETGERIIKFSKLCHHYKGDYAGKPIELLPHQEFYLIQLFGWKRPDGLRRFRRSYKEIARKNAKTTESAIKGLFLLSKDGEAGPQIYAAATKEEQARIVVNDAGKIANNSPFLRGKFETYRFKDSIKRVAYLPSNGFMTPIGRDSETQDGFDPYVGIMDEFHAHPDDGLLNVIQSGMNLRSQPLIDIITTAGYNLDGPCYKLRKTCIDILEGRKEDDSTLALIYTLDDEKDWENEEEWIKANPNMTDAYLRDRSILPALRIRYQQAKNEGSSVEVDFKTKNLNLWCDAPDIFISDSAWMANRHDINPEDLRGEACFGGLDLATGVDLCAFSLIFPGVRDKVSAILCWCFMPEDKVRSNKLGFDYTDWVRSGHIITTPGNIIDIDYLVHFISEKIKPYYFISGAYDPYIAAHGTLQGLINDGQIWHPISQGWKSISTPTKELERRAHAGELEHFGNPVLRWMISNTTLRTDPNGNVKIDKGRPGVKIDGVAATINALAESMSTEISNDTSFTSL